MTARTSSATWRGGLNDGGGDLALGSGAFTGSYSFVSRFEDGDGTNPEELLGAAHAACFSMALSNMLAQDGNPPNSVHTEATVHLGTVDGQPTITHIELKTVGDVPGLDDAGFQTKAEQAKEGCPVSKLFTGADITLDASLSA